MDGMLSSMPSTDAPIPRNISHPLNLSPRHLDFAVNSISCHGHALTHIFIDFASSVFVFSVFILMPLCDACGISLCERVLPKDTQFDSSEIGSVCLCVVHAFFPLFSFVLVEGISFIEGDAGGGKALSVHQQIMMHKSTTNRDSAENPSASIVSKASVGQRVLVNGHFGGVLRYLGAVAGRHGLFCGVELDQRVGRNDGSHGGIAYFECPAGHGIFAPTHKVQPEFGVESGRIPTIAHRNHHWHQQQSHHPPNGTERMTTSSGAEIPSNGCCSTDAPPSIDGPPQQLQQLQQQQQQCSSVSSSHHGQVPPLPMDWSLMSIGSTNSDGSAGAAAATAAAAHFNIFDDALMANSQVTYTVFDSDCMMLSDLELTDSTVLRLDDEDGDEDDEQCYYGHHDDDDDDDDAHHHQQKCQFMMMMMEEGGEMPPVDEMKRVSAARGHNNANATAAFLSLDRSVVLDGPTLNLALPVIESNKTMRTAEDQQQNEEETPTPMVEMRGTMDDDFRRRSEMGSRHHEEDRLNRNHLKLQLPAASRERPKSMEETQKPTSMHSSALLLLHNANNNSTNGVAAATTMLGLSVSPPQNNNNNNRCRLRGEEDETQRKETPKRPRIPLFQTAAPHHSNPMRAKCKPPSKSQMIMEQLKASIEAEKQRAKQKREEEEEEEKKRTIKREEEEEKKRIMKREEEKKRTMKREEEEEKKRTMKREEEEEKKRTMADNDEGGNEKSEEDTNLAAMDNAGTNMKDAKLKKSLLAPMQTQQQRPLLARTFVVHGSHSAPNQQANSFALPRSNSRIASSAPRPVLSSRENTSMALKGGMSPMSAVSHRPMTAKSQCVEQVAVARKHSSGISRDIATSEKVKESKSGKVKESKKDKVRESKSGKSKEAKIANAADERLKIEAELDRTKQLFKHTAKALDVFTVVASHFAKTLDDANAKRDVLLGAQKDHMETQHQRTIADCKCRLDQMEAQHQRDIDDLECNWKRRLQQQTEQHRLEVEDIRSKTAAEHSEKVAQLQIQQKVAVTELEQHVQRLQKQLAEQEQKHRMELAESTSYANNRLQKELESQNFELQMKGTELLKLRQTNRELQFEVDKLPEKDTQIVKLEARIGDLRDEVNRLRQVQKKLTVTLEGFHHELNDSRAKAEAITKQKEILEYQLNNGQQQQSEGEQICGQQQIAATPRTIRTFVSPSTFSTTTTPLKTPEMQRKRNSHLLTMSCHNSNGKISHASSQFEDNNMSRSMDSTIACYRTKPANTPTKIYTPRDVLEVPSTDLSSSPTTAGSRVVNFDSMREDSEEPKGGEVK